MDSKTFKRLSPLSLLVLSACGGGGTSIGGGSFSVGGRVIKGPLEGAWVRLDYDDPTIPDSTPVETDEFGAYTITALNNNYTVVAVTDEGTIDKSSDTTLSGVTLKAPQGASVVTPSTTLMEEGDLTADQVAEVLGLPDGVDPLSFNPFDIDETDATQVANALAVEKASQQVMSVVTAFASAAEGAGASEADAFTAALNSVVKVVQDKAANLTKEGATDAEKSLNLTNADDLALIQTRAEAAVEDISGLSEIQVAAFDNLAADTATAVINVNDRIAGVEDLDDGADVFSSVQVLAGQVAEAVADEVETPESGSIAFTSVTAVANSVLNSAPTAIELSSVSFSEATGVSIAIGTLITTDPDNASGFKYSIAQAQGTDYSNFVVDSDTGQLYFLEQPDYETKSSYTVRISSEDPGGKVFSETFEIKVTDSNEAPVLSLPVVGAVSEDASVLVVEGTLSGSDPEGGELSYSISDVAVDSGVYTASGTYGVLVLIEATGSYTYTINNELPAVNSLGSSDIVSDEFEVKVGDGTNTSSAQTLTITIQGQNDAPTAPILSNSNIDENVAGDSVGEIASSDAEGQDVSYTIADGGDGASFEINGSTLKLKSSVTADVETKSIYTVTVDAGDGSESSSATFTVNVSDKNDTPVVSQANVTVSAAEDSAFSYNLIENNIVFSDQDEAAGDELTLTLSESTPAWISLNEAGDSLVGTPLNADAGVSNFSIIASDKAGQNVSLDVTANVTSNNDAPVMDAVVGASVGSNEVGPVVAVLTAADEEDGISGFTFKIVDSTGSEVDDSESLFEISADGVSLKLKDTVTTDLQETPSYEVFVQAIDSGGASSSIITISVDVTGDTPPEITEFNISTTGSDAALGVGDIITITALTSEPVNQDGTVTLTLSNNETIIMTRDVTIGNKLSGTYEVEAGQQDTTTLSITSYNGTIIDNGGLSLAAVTDETPLSGGDFSVDATAPTTSLDQTVDALYTVSTSTLDLTITNASELGLSDGDIKANLDWASLSWDVDKSGADPVPFSLSYVTSATLDASAGTLSIVLNSDGIAAFEPLADFGGSEVTGTLDGLDMGVGFFRDIAGNDSSASNVANLTIDLADTTAPTINSIAAAVTTDQDGDGYLDTSDVVTFTATMDSEMKSGTDFTMRLSNDQTVTMVTSSVDASEMTGTYTVGSSDADFSSLAASSYTVVDAVDTSGNALDGTSTITDLDAAVESATLKRDATAPTTSLDQTVDALYTVSTSTLDLTITNASELGLSDGDIKANLDWASLSWDVDKSGADPVPFSSNYVTSATLDARGDTLSIVLNSDGIAAFEPLAGFGGSEVTGTLDGLDMGVGFFRDIAGNDSSASNVANLTIDLADTRAPTISSIAAAVTTDQDGDGYLDTSDVVTFTATMDSAMKSGTDFTMRLSNDQTVTMVTSSVDASEMTGTYTVGSSDSDFSSLAVSSYTVVDAVDTSGNALDGTSTITDLDAAVERATLKRDATAPTTSLDQTVDALYTVSTSTLDLTITNASELGLSNGDIKANLDWASLSWDVDKSGADPVPFSSNYVTSATLDARADTLSIVLNSDGIAAFEPLAGFGGSDATGTLDGLDMGVGFFRDIAGNDSSASNVANLTIDLADTRAPTISSIAAAVTTDQDGDGYLDTSDVVTFTATMDSEMKSGTDFTMRLSNDQTVTMVTSSVDASEMTGTYTVGSSDSDFSSLAVSSYTVVDAVDTSGNALDGTSTITDLDAAVERATLKRDATAPTTSLDQTVDALYTVSTSTLDLTITNASELGLSNGDIKANLDWASLSWDVDKSGADPVPFSLSYVTSATLDARGDTLSIVLNSDGIAAFEPLAGFGGSDATGTLDGLDMGVGFFRDIAGNDSSASNVANLTIDLADTRAPTISSIAAVATGALNGKLNGGDSISFSAEVDSVIKAGTSFNMLLDNGDTISMSTGASNSNTLSGSLTLTNDSVETDLLSVQSYTVVDAVDLSGNALVSDTAVANFDQVKDSSIKIDTTAPGLYLNTFEADGVTANLLTLKFTEAISNTSEVDAALRALNIVDNSTSGTWSGSDTVFQIETNEALTENNNDLTLSLTFEDLAGNSVTLNEIEDFQII